MAYKQLLAVVAAILVVTGAVPGGAAIVAAQESPTPEPGDPGPPSVPAAYYGNITIDGEPAPAGTTIEAVVDGEVRGSITINESGQYGGPSNLDPKLSVQPPENSSNDTVQFFVDNDNIERTRVATTDPETVEFESNDIKRVDLSASVAEPLLEVDITDIPANVNAGDALPVEFNITNAGVDAGENRTITVSVNGEVRETFVETLEVNETRQFAADVSTNTDDVGNATVTVDTGDRTGSAPVVVNPATLSVTDLTVGDREVATNEPVPISVTLNNPSDTESTETVEVRAGDSVLDSTTVDVSPQSTRTAELDPTLAATGEQTLTITGDEIDTRTRDVSVVSPVVRTFDVTPTSTVVGEQVEVVAEVENNRRSETTVPVTVTGTPSGTSTANLTVAGETTDDITFVFAYDTAGARDVSLARADDTQTVEVIAPAVPLAVTPDPVAAAPGEDISFTVTRVDTGEEVDGVELDFVRPDSAVAVPETGNVTSGFTTSFETPGEYSVTVSDARPEDRDTVNFTSGSAEFEVLPPADLSIAEAETPVPAVPAGTPVPALVTVENDGEVPATQTLRLVAGTGDSSDVLVTRNVTVAPGERTVELAGALQPSGSSLPDDRTLVVKRFSNATSEDAQESATIGEVTALSPLPVTDISLQSEVVDADNDVRVNVTVENVAQSPLGSEFGSQNVTVTVGDNSTEKNFTPAAGAEQTQTYVLSPPGDGAAVNVTIAPEFGENRTRTVEIEEGVQDVGLTANRTPVEPGEPIQFTLSTSDTNFNADIEVVDTQSGDVEEEIEAVATNGGTATVSLDDPGVYEVRTADHSTDAPVDPGRTTVRVLEPGDVRVIDAAVTTPEVVRTETVNVTVTLVNPGETTASENVTIAGQDNPNATQNVSVDPGNLTTVTLATNFTTEGSESIAVETEDTTAVVPAGTVEVTPALVVEDVRISPRPVTVGDTVSIDVDVRNRAPDSVDDGTIDRTLTLAIDGADENETTQSAFSEGTYDAGETKTITFTPDVLSPVQDPGVRQVTVDESNLRTIAVSRQSVDLSLDISDQQTVGEPVTFTVNASGEPVDATLRLPARAPIDVVDGTATETFNAPIQSNIVVTKSANDTTRFVPTSGELSVSEPADVAVTRAETNVTEVFAGQQVGVSLTVRNVGGDTGSGTVNITEINGDRTLKTVTTGTLSPGETRTLDAAVELNDTGVRTLEAGGLIAGTAIVDDAVAVTDTDIPSAATADESFEVNVTVADRVADGETESINLTVTAGDESAEQTVTPGDGSSTTERFAFSFNDSVTAQVETDDRVIATDRIEVSQQTVGLSLAVNESEIAAGDSVSFTVTDEDGNPIDATVEVARRSVSTDSETGEATTAIPTIGNFTAVAIKSGTPARAFTSASTQVNVTDPLAVSVANNFTTASVGPGQGTNREAATQSRDVVINNTGGRPIQLGGIGFLGADAGQYRIVDETLPRSVAPNSEAIVSVRFEPTVRGDTDAQFRLRAGTSRNQIRTVPLNGTGTGPDVEVNRTSVGFGTDIASGAPQQSETINVSNDGNRPLSVDPGSLGAGFTVSPGSETVIDPGESQEFTARFDPSGLSPNDFGDILQLETNDTFDGTVSLGLTATISEGELRVSPTSLDAGEVAVDGTATFDVVVSNTGTDTIETINATNETTANGLSVVDVGPDDTEPVVEELDPGSQELVAVQLTQTADADTSSANVTFVPAADAIDNQTVTIDATPIAPTLSTDPGIDSDPNTDEVDLGEVATGSTATDTFEITNNGDATLRLTNVRIDGPTGTPFGLATESETLTIQPGGTQSLTVQFTPQNADTFDESDLAFEFNDPSVDGTSEVTADLTGRGIETTLEGDTSSVRFGTIGSSSTATDTIEITNGGNTELTINSITVRGPDAGQFDADPSGSVEGNTLGAGDNATVPLQYAPTAAAAHVAEVSVIASGPDGLNEFTATLRGEAAPPEAAVDDRSIAFGFVNAKSDETASGSVEVENVGDDATTLTVTSVSATGDGFSVTSESSFDLDGGESQPVTVEFDPDSGDSGSITGTLTIETDDPDAAAIDIDLEGQAAAPDTTANRTSTDFGQVPTGTQSATRTVGITNDGGAAATVTDVALDDTSEFTIVSGFEGTLVPGETAPVTVRTTPADAGSTDTNLTVTNASGSDIVDVQLQADGTVPELTVSNGIDPDFGEIGSSSSTAQTLSIENTGNATLRADISATGEAFSVPESQQTLRLSPGGTTDVRVTFSPPGTGDFDGTVVIDTNDGSTTELPASGSGGEANASVSPSTVDFGRVTLDTETTETITLTNEGVGQLNITQTTIAGRDAPAFDVTGLDASTLGSGDSTTFEVTVDPTVTRGLSGQLTIGTGDTSDVTVSLSATGTAPEIDVATSSVSFDRTRLGATSTETIDIRNTGNSPLNVSSVRVSGADADQFAIDSDAAVIAPGGSRTVPVEFTPNNNETAARQGTVQSAIVTIRSNDTSEAVTTVDLSGQSKTPDLQLPALERFGTLQVGQTTTQSLEVTNDPTATASISLDSLTIIGSDADEFSVDPPTDRSLSPGESAEINVSVTPESGGIKTASLLVATNDPRQSLESVSLSNDRTIAVVEYGSVTFDYNGVTGTDPKFKSSNDPSTGVIGIDPRLNTATDFELRFSTRSEAAGPALGDSSDVAAKAVRYLEIENTNIAPSQHDETTVQFRVSKTTINNLGSVEDGITLYQYDGSEYEALSTTRIPGDDTASEFAYQATFTNFNDLVIAAGQPDLGLTSASASGVPDTLESGQTTTVTVSADVENTGSIAGSDTVRVRDSGSTLNSTTVNVGAGGTPTVPVDVDLTGPGSRTLTVAFGGQTQDVTVDIDSPDDGGPPAGGGDDDDAPADEPTDVPAPVEEIGAEPETVESVTPTVDADAGQTVAEFETADTVEAVALDTTEDVGEVTVTELDPDTVESDTDTEPVPGDTAAVQDISVPDEVEDTSATIEFEVSTDRVDGDADTVSVFRLTDGEWQPLDTEVVETTGDTLVLEAETPGFSLFAVSEVQPPEASLSLDPAPVRTGDEVTLSGAESADPDGEVVAYEWSVDGETLTGETVTVTLDEPGEYTVELAVTDDAGETDTVTETLVVEAADTATATPAPDTPEPDVESPTEGPAEEPGGFDTLPVIVVAIVLLLAAGYVAYRQREQ